MAVSALLTPLMFQVIALTGKVSNWNKKMMVAGSKDT